MVAFGSKTIGERGSLVDWLKGLVVNDTWPALNDLSVGGGQRTFAAWCLALGLAFYFWFGIQHAGWIDVGVYSVTIALMASGFALNHASRVPPGDENIIDQRCPLRFKSASIHPRINPCQSAMLQRNVRYRRPSDARSFPVLDRCNWRFTAPSGPIQANIS